MAYAPYTWRDGQNGGTPLTADRLNYLENGVASAATTADAATTALDTKAPLTRALPAGGTAGQYLVKNSSTDYNAGWQSPSTTVPAHTHPQSAIDSLSSDLDAIRLGSFGGTGRTRPPAAYCYYAADSSTLAASTNYIMAGGWTKYADPDGMLSVGNGTITNPVEWTVPVDGMYLLEFHSYSSATTGLLYSRFLYNANSSATVDARVSASSFVNSTGFAAPEGTHSHVAVTRGLAAGSRVQASIYSTVAFVLRAGVFGMTQQTRMGVRWLGPLQS